MHKETKKKQKKTRLLGTGQQLIKVSKIFFSSVSKGVFLFVSSLPRIQRFSDYIIHIMSSCHHLRYFSLSLSHGNLAAFLLYYLFLLLKSLPWENEDICRLTILSLTSQLHFKSSDLRTHISDLFMNPINLSRFIQGFLTFVIN